MKPSGRSSKSQGASDSRKSEANDDDDFGEFEGFEGETEQLQAQSKPSPWATFPDLLPVQRSPATEDIKSAELPLNASDIASSVPEADKSMLMNRSINLSQARQSHNFNQPDVSIGTNGAVGSSATCSEVRDLSPQPLEREKKIKNSTELQNKSPRRQNIKFEEAVSCNQVQLNELETKFQETKNSLLEMKEIDMEEIKQNFQKIQEDVITIKQGQLNLMNEIEKSNQNIEEMKKHFQKVLEKEANIHTKWHKLEETFPQALDKKFDEIKADFKPIIQQCISQVSNHMSQLIQESINQKFSSSAESLQENNLLLLIQTKLEEQKELQEKILNEGNRKQMIVVSQALELALRHIHNATKDVIENDLDNELST